MMTKQISLKTLKNLSAQGFKERLFAQQDESLKGGDAIDTGHVDSAKRHLTVRMSESAGATVATKTALKKINRKDPKQSSSYTRSEPVMVPGPEPEPQPKINKSRVEHGQKEKWKTSLRKYSCELTVDTNAVHKNLKLSDHNRKVTCVREEQSYPDHPDRFDVYLQLLCSTGLTGRCYWEVEWSGWVEISVSYRRMSRRGNGDDCRFGFNAQSWTLECSQYVDGYSVQHNNRRTNLSSSSVSGRAAVYVDCPAGTLSFYEVSSDQLIHLHTFNTTFTEPLYPGFGLLSPGSVVCLSVEQEQESHAIIPVCV